MTASTSPLATESPLLLWMALMTPVTGAGSAFSIFMASMTTTVSPSFTVSPTFFSYRMIIPGMGALMGVPSTATGSTAFTGAGLATAGAALGLGGGGGRGDAGFAGAAGFIGPEGAALAVAGRTEVIKGDPPTSSTPTSK